MGPPPPLVADLALMGLVALVPWVRPMRWAGVLPMVRLPALVGPMVLLASAPGLWGWSCRRARGVRRLVRMVFVFQHLYFGAREALDVAEEVAFVPRAKGIGGSLRSRSGRAADAVHVAFRFVGQVIVYDVGDAFDVDAARGDVGCHQNLGAA